MTGTRTTELVEVNDLDDFTERAATWLEDSVPGRWRNNRGSLSPAESDAIRHDWDRQLALGGFAGISLPRDYGGQGKGLAEEIAFSVLAGKAKAPDGFGRVGKVLVAPMLIARGTERQRTTYVPRIISGEQVWCQG